MIDGTVHANMTAIVVLSMVLTPLLVIVFEKWLEPKLAANPSIRQADDIHEDNAVILVGMGRFGQIVADVLMMSGKSLTIIDKSAFMVDGLNRYGVKTHFGDAARPELLIAAGIDKAKMLIIAIDDKEQALHITEFARKVNPNIKIIARAYDRIAVYKLYKAGGNELIRETFDSALRTGKTALELLGMDKHKSQEIADLYFRRDRHMLVKMAPYFDPNVGLFQNREMAENAKRYDDETKAMIQAVLDDEVVLWSADEDDENDAIETVGKRG